MAHKQHKKQQTKVEKRPIDLLFEQYALYHQQGTNQFIHWFVVPLMTFSISGIIWSIPFPHLNFLGQYNGFINWFTLFMAVVVYYYLRLAPTLSYVMLLTFGLFSYLIVHLEYWEQAGGPTLWSVCLILLIISCIGQFIGYKTEQKKPSFSIGLQFLLTGPIWLWHVIFKKLKFPY
ncbi:DUF962 domain-containing protein [Olivibacter ginsenosidimutans]|uniref:DUF962 domain-containing protein n=1 Tax=Olivibacter ginsenosidimutans TaxID=1176537 RepID=A0ABP9BJP3_9SPHI